MPISPVDPAAHWTGADGGAAYFAYSTNYLVGIAKLLDSCRRVLLVGKLRYHLDGISFAILSGYVH